MNLDNLPDELKALYAHRCPADAERKAAYEQSVLSSEPDSFVLYRIIGNDLYPRHAKGQSRQNVRFILENEPELADCEKRWVLNRIFDAGERQAIIELLEQHGHSYLEIPFEAEAFAQIGWDYSAFPEPGFLSSAAFHKLEPRELQQERVLTAAYRKKNLYLMNNNGARNAALEDGRSRAKWVLPWDGNCFVTPSAWEAIRSAVRAAPYLPYFAVPMQRITDNAELLRDDFAPSPVEEPQLLFRRDARERFGENHPYGRRPKVELFWRFGIPGKWDRWKDASWDQPRAEPSPEAGAWGVAGWVARLASGKAHLEASTNEGFQNRGVERQKAIRAAINHVTREVSAQPDPIGLTSYRFEAIEALRAEYQGQSESGPRAGLLQTLLQNAAEALDRQPESPVDKPEPGPSGDPQDYYHPAPYWWPNPDTKDGLPYVRRDGERVPGTRMYEPESHRYDRTRLQRLFDDTTTLALAAFVTGDQRYATHAVRWLERWFIDPATRMNPHLTYAQVRWGRNGNRGAQTGIIEMKDLYYALDAVRLLHHAGALSSDQMERLCAWFREYLDWLLTSEQGTKEAQARNNHGTYYDLQVAAIAAFLDYHDTLHATLARAEERIPLQVSPTGIQYEEMTRTITAHYCCFTLQGWLNLLNLASRFDGSFVARAAEPDHPLRKAVEWLLAHEGFPWPYPQIDEFDDRRPTPIAALGFQLCIAEGLSSTKTRAPALYSPHDGINPYWNLNLSDNLAFGGGVGSLISITAILGVVRDDHIRIELESSSRFSILEHMCLVLRYQGEKCTFVEQTEILGLEGVRFQEGDSSLVCSIPISALPKNLVSIALIKKDEKRSDYVFVKSKDWHLDNLSILTEEEFFKKMSNMGMRVPDEETLAFVAYQTSLNKSLDKRFRMSALVIALYKNVELGHVVKLRNLIRDIEHQEGWFPKIRFARGNKVRKDGRQMIVSLLTAKWHVGMALRDPKVVRSALLGVHDWFHALDLCESRNELNSHLTDRVIETRKASLSKNFANGLLLLAVLAARGGAAQYAEGLCNELKEYGHHLSSIRKDCLSGVHGRDLKNSTMAVDRCESWIGGGLSGLSGDGLRQLIKLVSRVRLSVMEPYARQFLSENPDFLCDLSG